MTLPERFLTTPIAHRGLHDKADGRPENSAAAIRAAVAAGYGIEIDVQPSADAQAMVFHDYMLDRLTAASGPIAARPASDLADLPLLGSHEGVPTLADVLAIVDGKVPLLVEIKDQDGALGPDVGPLEAAVAAALSGYEGDVAVMSFNPNSVAAMARCLPDTPRGLVTEDFFDPGYDALPEPLRAALTRIDGFGASGASFISHNHRDLATEPVARLKSAGVPVLCWTIKSSEEEATARKIADNVTFEGYLP